MRYFKYEDGDKTEKDILREQYRELTAIEKRIFRRKKWINQICVIVFVIVSIGTFLGCLRLIGLIQEPGHLVWTILCVLSKVALTFGALIFSFIVGILMLLAFGEKREADHRAMKRELLSNACEDLRVFYGLQEPCIVTKCYDSSDKRFVDHDVCLFVVGSELRITTNLKHGFFERDKDLGCYAFEAEEISILQIPRETSMATVLKAGDVEFLLCYRGGRFVETNFIGIPKMD